MKKYEKFFYLEKKRQQETLSFIAAENILSKKIRQFDSSIIGNKTTEGISRHRYHGGSNIIDRIELECIESAKNLFNARFANVQAHSCTQANQAVIFSVLNPGDKILSMSLKSGGHITHGNPSIIGQLFNVESYNVNLNTELLDFESIRNIAIKFKPKLIICGASSYPRKIDFKKFREIADDVGAYLLADIAHIAGLVASNHHISPINHAHFTTLSTYKTLRGPRGGLILMGNDFDKISKKFPKKTLSKAVNYQICPGLQSAIHSDHIFEKLVCFELCNTKKFNNYQKQIISNANQLSIEFNNMNYSLFTKGTDNHMIILDFKDNDMTGYIAEKALEECNIIVNRNVVPFDTRKPQITSGLRIGVPSVTSRGIKEKEIKLVCKLIDEILSNINVINDKEYELNQKIKKSVLLEIKKLTTNFPIDEI
jgi:glycine hydroxymethyltransferase